MKSWFKCLALVIAYGVVVLAMCGIIDVVPPNSILATVFLAIAVAGATGCLVFIYKHEDEFVGED